MKQAKLERWITSVWYEDHPPGLAGGLILGLLSTLYGAVVSFKHSTANVLASRSENLPVPVLIIGNLIAGGAGKTPVVQAVCRQMKERGYKVGILTRGYGRKSIRPLIIESAKPVSAEECGDEPAWLLANTDCPIAVGADRDRALKDLLVAHPDLDLVVSDDGLQHLNLRRTLEWVVFDERGAGNLKLLPSGPLREPLSRLNTVDAVLTGHQQPELLALQLQTSVGLNWHPTPLKPLGFRNLGTGQEVNLNDALVQWQDLMITAFTGLGNPSKLFGFLEKLGFKIENAIPLPDHFDYPDDFCTGLAGNLAITTGKDAVKLKGNLNHVWETLIQIDLPAQLIDQIEAIIGLSPD